MNLDTSLSSNLIINLSIIFSQPTGISNYAQNLFPYLKFLQPTLLTSQRYPDFDCYEIPNNLTPAQGTKGHLNRLIWTQFQLPKIYQQLKSNLLFSPIPEAPINSKCRYVVTFHDAIPLRFPKKRSPLTYYHRYYVPRILRKAEHIICNSEATAKDIHHFYQAPKSKITPILLAHDTQHFRPLANNNIQQDNPYFLYLGRQDPYKNLQRIISAFAALPISHEYQLWFAGSEDKRYTPLLKTQIQELGITERVKFLNYVPYSELPKIINQAVALVFPSLWEGFGFPVLEAMACGTPVITSNISSLPEVAGDAAILVNPYHTGELTEAMQLIATDEQLRNSLSNLGIERAKEFSWEKTGKATVEVLSRFV
ncbi:glycosyltransferase [Rivularia sp. PCC 7116]|uniref:glycosyltransferase family 4 protein n=1 Tax=Rivularia sp. PCC 7116 TaxID=373994 RepID=UPI00029F2B1E|nr:glycosyltransferase family 1 protein [Rivularia sp. PCC 7116]AFY58277.1 glycosyltransferase [Rivularia sp. PCC 7116]